eukprot:6284891-Karenia_brevis.AAC.1
MRPAEAASFRGHLNFLLCSSFGSTARFGLRPLIAQQYVANVGPLPEALDEALGFFERLLPTVRPVRVPLWGPPKAPFILYTDAS